MPCDPVRLVLFMPCEAPSALAASVLRLAVGLSWGAAGGKTGITRSGSSGGGGMAGIFGFVIPTVSPYM